MGYYTRFELEIDRDGEAVIESLCAVSEYTRFDLDSPGTWVSEDRSKWYDHEDDLKAASLAHPISRITVTGYGETAGDIWRKYFVAGQMQAHKLEIAFPPCTLAKPGTSYRTIEVSVFGHDVPVEVEFIEPKTNDELYEMAKAQLRRAL